MSALIDLMKETSAKNVESHMFNDTDYTTPEHTAPLLQLIVSLAFSGYLSGEKAGIPPGLIFLAGPSKSAKTSLGISAVKDYLDYFPDAICLFYDSELGGGDSWNTMDVDMDRVVHVAIKNVEDLKFDLVKKLTALENLKSKTPLRIIIFVDSLGGLASKKEGDDAESESSKADMTRARQIKSLLRIITPRIGFLKIPAIIVNHTGMSIGGMFPTENQTGGQAVTLAPNTVIFFGKTKLYSDGEDATTRGFAGSMFKLKINKSRNIKENSVLNMPWWFGEDRPSKNSGMYELAVEHGIVYAPSKGWRAVEFMDPETGEVEEFKFREKQVFETPEIHDEFIQKIFDQTKFVEIVERKYRL